MPSIMPTGKQQFFAPGTAIPLVGGKLYTYAAGTSTPKATYQDAAGTTPNTNPITLDSAGSALIFWDGAYKIVLKDAAGNTVYSVDNYSSDPLGVKSFIASLVDKAGTTLVGFIQALTGAKQRTAADKLGERVSVADFLDTDAPTASQAVTAIQAAINSGAQRVFVSKNYSINGPITLAANQILDFDGGSLTASGAYPNGVLAGNGLSGVHIIDPVIDSSASAGTDGVRAISLINCPGGRIYGGKLTGGIIGLEGPDNATRMDYKVRGTIINAGAKAPCVYVSAVLGATFEALTLTGGQEGVGIYNDCRDIDHTACKSYSQIQDGFVVIAGQRIGYTNCRAYSNSQSGFTTQRQTAATNTQNVTYAGCQSYDNAYDGFDLRGANDGTSWNTDMLVVCSGCISRNNTGTGFYIVNAEGTILSGCFAASNQQQNIFVNNSNRVTLTGCESSSGANAVAAGVNKAGIIIYNSGAVTIAGCHSSNSSGSTQNYGISFTGTSTACTVIGGFYENDTVAPYNLTAGNRLVAAQADTDSGSGIFLKAITQHGTYEEEGFGIPAHVRPLGSTFNRLDGGAAELYRSNGGGNWTKFA